MILKQRNLSDSVKLWILQTISTDVCSYTKLMKITQVYQTTTFFMEIVCYVILTVRKYTVVQVIKEIQNQIYALECALLYWGWVFLPTTGISHFLLRYSPFCTRQPCSYKVFFPFFSALNTSICCWTFFLQITYFPVIMEWLLFL